MGYCTPYCTRLNRKSLLFKGLQEGNGSPSMRRTGKRLDSFDKLFCKPAQWFTGETAPGSKPEQISLAAIKFTRYCTRYCTQIKREDEMGKLLTDAAIQAAMRRVKRGDVTEATLADAAPRGAGKLVLVVRGSRAEWYARRIETGRVRKEKLGAYPALTLEQARAAFAEARERGPRREGATVGALFDAYLEHLQVAGKSTRQPKALLDHAADVIGRDTLAADVKPADVVAVIRPVFQRGSRVQADKYRAFMSAAFRWAMRAAHDYRTDGARDWGLRSNPAEAVPRDTEAEGVGTRWLSAAEFRDLLAHLQESPTRGRTNVREAIALLLLTGQRVREVLGLRAEQWNSQERTLAWQRTKNGQPHLLPVCSQAAAILDGLVADTDGWLFPGQTPTGHAPDGSVLVYLKRYARARRLKPFSGRDLRRTWKTLAGEAGLTKVERDLLQNHTESDVSSRHYDRYAYLREKREAVAKWEAWLASGTSHT